MNELNDIQKEIIDMKTCISNIIRGYDYKIKELRDIIGILEFRLDNLEEDFVKLPRVVGSDYDR